MLPEIVNNNYDPMAQQANMASLFQNRENSLQSDIENQRKNYLAAAEVPSQISGYNLKNAQNVGALQALPQQQAIAKQEMDKTQKFNILQQMDMLFDIDTVPEDIKKEMFLQGINKVTQITQGVPDFKLADGGRSAAKANAAKEFFLNLLNENPQGLRAEIRKSLSSLARTPQTTAAEDLQRVKDTGAQTATLLHADPLAPASYMGFGNDQKEAESLRKFINDENNNIRKNSALEGQLKELGFMIDDANRLQQVQGANPNADQRSKADALLEQAKDLAMRRTQNARIKYYKLMGLPQDEFTGGSAPSGSPTSTGLDPAAAAAELKRRREAAK